MRMKRRYKQKILGFLFSILMILGVFFLISTVWDWIFGPRTSKELLVISSGRAGNVNFKNSVTMEGNQYYDRYVLNLEGDEYSFTTEEYSTGLKVIIKNSSLKDVELKSDTHYTYNETIDILFSKGRLEVNIPTAYKDNYVYKNPVSSEELNILVAKKENPYTSSVVLDPGHGGVDAGANSGDLLEKDINLQVANYMRMELIYNGCNVTFTRENDDVSGTELQRLREITAMANSISPDVFVSLHVNSYDTSEVKGVEVYYYTRGHEDQAEQRENLASTIQKYLVSSDGWTDNGVKTGNYQVLRDTDMPSVLVELGYISNDEDLARLSNSTILYNAAQNINKGILEYLSNR